MVKLFKLTNEKIAICMDEGGEFYENLCYVQYVIVNENQAKYLYTSPASPIATDFMIHIEKSKLKAITLFDYDLCESDLVNIQAIKDGYEKLLKSVLGKPVMREDGAVQ